MLASLAEVNATRADLPHEALPDPAVDCTDFGIKEGAQPDVAKRDPRDES